MARYIDAEKMIADTQAMTEIETLKAHLDETYRENKKLKQHIYELSVALDNQSAERNLVALRRTHYNNIKWIHDNGLEQEYYDFWYNAHFVEEGDHPNKQERTDACMGKENEE